jgi:hypothetical protein
MEMTMNEGLKGTKSVKILNKFAQVEGCLHESCMT